MFGMTYFCRAIKRTLLIYAMLFPMRNYVLHSFAQQSFVNRIPSKHGIVMRIRSVNMPPWIVLLQFYEKSFNITRTFDSGDSILLHSHVISPRTSSFMLESRSAHFCNGDRPCLPDFSICQNNDSVVDFIFVRHFYRSQMNSAAQSSQFPRCGRLTAELI